MRSISVAGTHRLTWALAGFRAKLSATFLACSSAGSRPNIFQFPTISGRVASIHAPSLKFISRVQLSQSGRSVIFEPRRRRRLILAGRRTLTLYRGVRPPYRGAAHRDFRPARQGRLMLGFFRSLSQSKITWIIIGLPLVAGLLLIGNTPVGAAEL